MGTRLVGVDIVSRNLGVSEQQIVQAVADGVNETAINLHADAVQNTPVDTGRLRSSIALRETATADDPSAEVATDVEYAAHVEYGTVHQTAQPYMRPAIERQLPQLDQNIAKHVRKRTG